MGYRLPNTGGRRGMGNSKEGVGFPGKASIRYTIFIYFTVSALVAILLTGVRQSVLWRD